MNTQADLQAKNTKFRGPTSEFSVYHFGKKLGEVKLNLPGIHNINNSLASIAVGIELDIPFKVIKKALEGLVGVQRRMEIKGEISGVIVMDDYGHHPTEIKTTIAAVRESWPDKRIVVVFQPHRYTRTKALFSEFTRSFYQTDILFILPIYAAGEEIIDEVDGGALYEGVRLHGHRNVTFCEDQETVISRLKKTAKVGDIILTLGAGNVWRLGETFIQEFKK
jgi:UDP-N-acetylmuramate--alanine ligase